MKLYLGVDGGQSSTTAVIGDEDGRVVGYGRGGPCNHVKGPEGRTKFENAIRSCVQLALQSAGLPSDTRFALAFLGFSGGPADKEAILHQILSAERIVVTHDGLIALAGATGGQPGIIMIAGTGSFAFGRNAARKTARAGGWGFAFGDEGGGYDLTRQALRAALRMEEGWGPPTMLREKLLSETGADSADDLIHRFYTVDYPRPKIASYSHLVEGAAVEGDGVARQILTQAAQHLATYASAVRCQLFQPQEDVIVSPIGGVFQAELISANFTQLMELQDGTRVVDPMYLPAVGALIEAYSAAGLATDLKDVPDLGK